VEKAAWKDATVEGAAAEPPKAGSLPGTREQKPSGEEATRAFKLV